MRQKIFNLNRTKEFESGEYVSFLYEGTIKNENYDWSALNEHVNAFINNSISCYDMLENVNFLRTILRDFEERKLIIDCGKLNKSNDVEKIYYEDGDLVFYRFVSSIYNVALKKDEASIHVNYEKYRCLDIKFCDFDNNIFDSLNMESINNIVAKQINHLNDLREIDVSKQERISAKVRSI